MSEPDESRDVHRQLRIPKPLSAAIVSANLLALACQSVALILPRWVCVNTGAGNTTICQGLFETCVGETNCTGVIIAEKEASKYRTVIIAFGYSVLACLAAFEFVVLFTVSVTGRRHKAALAIALCLTCILLPLLLLLEVVFYLGNVDSFLAAYETLIGTSPYSYDLCFYLVVGMLVWTLLSWALIIIYVDIRASVASQTPGPSTACVVLESTTSQYDDALSQAAEVVDENPGGPGSRQNPPPRPLHNPLNNASERPSQLWSSPGSSAPSTENSALPVENPALSRGNPVLFRENPSLSRGNSTLSMEFPDRDRLDNRSRSGNSMESDNRCRSENSMNSQPASCRRQQEGSRSKERMFQAFIHALPMLDILREARNSHRRAGGQKERATVTSPPPPSPAESFLKDSAGLGGGGGDVTVARDAERVASFVPSAESGNDEMLMVAMPETSHAVPSSETSSDITSERKTVPKKTSAPEHSSGKSSAPVTSTETTPLPTTSSEMPPAPETSGELTSQPDIFTKTTSFPKTSSKMVSASESSMALAPQTSDEMTSWPYTSGEMPQTFPGMTSQIYTSDGMTPKPKMSSELSSRPDTSSEMTSRPETFAEITEAPETPFKMTATLETSGKIISSPETTSKTHDDVALGQDRETKAQATSDKGDNKEVIDSSGSAPSVDSSLSTEGADPLDSDSPEPNIVPSLSTEGADQLDSDSPEPNIVPSPFRRNAITPMDQRHPVNALASQNTSPVSLRSWEDMAAAIGWGQPLSSDSTCRDDDISEATQESPEAMTVRGAATDVSYLPSSQRPDKARACGATSDTKELTATAGGSKHERKKFDKKVNRICKTSLIIGRRMKLKIQARSQRSFTGRHQHASPKYFSTFAAAKADKDLSEGYDTEMEETCSDSSDAQVGSREEYLTLAGGGASDPDSEFRRGKRSDKEQADKVANKVIKYLDRGREARSASSPNTETGKRFEKTNDRNNDKAKDHPGDPKRKYSMDTLLQKQNAVTSQNY